jgi:hypothetical protein
LNSQLFDIAARLGREHAHDAERFGLHWQEHIERSRDMILQGAARVATPDSVTVLGGGAAYNIPLEELAQRFKVVRLVDLDTDSVPAEVRAKVEVHTGDVSGGLAMRLVEQGLEIVRSSATFDEALPRLIPLFKGEGLDMTYDPSLVEPWKASYVVSSGLSSQMTIVPERAVIEALRERFGTEIEDDFFFKQGSFQLRNEWVRLHGELLSGLVAPDGRVYWADTVAETPYLQEFGAGPLAILVDCVMGFLNGAYLKTFVTEAGKHVLAERFGEGWSADQLLNSFKDRLDIESKRRLTWAIMTLVGENLIQPKRELELVKYVIREAERMTPQARQPMLSGPLSSFFPSSLEPDGEGASWIWINDPEGAVTLNGSSYYVEAWILQPRVRA